mgnify:CR=1
VGAENIPRLQLYRFREKTKSVFAELLARPASVHRQLLDGILGNVPRRSETARGVVERVDK